MLHGSSCASSVQLLSCVRLFVTPWTVTCQASLSITNSWSLLKLIHWIGDAIEPSHPLSSLSLSSGPITSWQIDWKIMETVTDFIFLGSKITAYGDCSYEINRHLLLGRKAMTNLGSILKSRDVTLPTKVHLVKVMVFPVVVYRYDSCIKKADCRRIDAFKLWCWKRLFRVPWAARRSKQSVLKEISPEYSLEGLILKLKVRYFCQLM